MLIVPHLWQLRHMWIAVAEQRSSLHQQFQQFKRGTFARIIHIFFVGHTQNADSTALDRLTLFIQKLGQASNHISRHAGIDFASQLNEASVHALQACQPAEIERVDRNTVPTKSGSRIKRLKSKRLCFSGVDDFPDINSHSIEQHL